jgi:hypothetical protein
MVVGRGLMVPNTRPMVEGGVAELAVAVTSVAGRVISVVGVLLGVVGAIGTLVKATGTVAVVFASVVNAISSVVALFAPNLGGLVFEKGSGSMVDPVFGTIDLVFGSIDLVFGSIDLVFGSIDLVFGMVPGGGSTVGGGITTGRLDFGREGVRLAQRRGIVRRVSFMSFLRPTPGFVTGVTFLVLAGGVARAEDSTPPDAPPKTVFVHLDAGPFVWVEASSLEGNGWSRAYEGPCDKALMVGPEYRLNGPDIRPSRPFQLDASLSQGVRITPNTASQEAYTGSFALVGIGSVAVAVGLVTVLVGALEGIAVRVGSCTHPCDASGPAGNPEVEAGGGIAALVGAAALVSGMLLVVHNAHSGLRQEPIPAKLPQRPDAAWLRTPVWQGAGKDPMAGVTRLGIPILSRTF